MILFVSIFTYVTGPALGIPGRLYKRKLMKVFSFILSRAVFHAAPRPTERLVEANHEVSVEFVISLTITVRL